jgi:hypothetical protein
MVLLPEGETGEAWVPYKKQCSYFHFSIVCGHEIWRDGGLDTKTDRLRVTQGQRVKQRPIISFKGLNGPNAYALWWDFPTLTKRHKYISFYFVDYMV